jgi:hypothetical protein
MRGLTILLALVVMSAADNAEAARRDSTPAQPTASSGQRTGFFGRLMELERAKNERLRQMFRGR